MATAPISSSPISVACKAGFFVRMACAACGSRKTAPAQSLVVEHYIDLDARLPEIAAEIPCSNCGETGELTLDYKSPTDDEGRRGAKKARDGRPKYRRTVVPKSDYTRMDPDVHRRLVLGAILAGGVVGSLIAYQTGLIADPIRAFLACDIKGNIGRHGEHVYHVPGDTFYSRTRIDPFKGERMFCSEQDALQAGWRRARR